MKGFSTFTYRKVAAQFWSISFPMFTPGMFLIKHPVTNIPKKRKQSSCSYACYGDIYFIWSCWQWLHWQKQSFSTWYTGITYKKQLIEPSHKKYDISTVSWSIYYFWTLDSLGDHIECRKWHSPFFPQASSLLNDIGVRCKWHRSWSDLWGKTCSSMAQLKWFCHSFR